MAIQNQYIISDTHFGHAKIIEFAKNKRPFQSIQEHDNELVLKWNSIVKPKDTIWHLGDVYFGGAANHEILASLNGYKKLILGNHDVYPTEIYQKYFHKIYSSAYYKEAILTHIPIHPDEFRKYKLNIHGHIHQRRITDPRYCCVSAEQTNLQPILLSEIYTIALNALQMHQTRP